MKIVLAFFYHLRQTGGVEHVLANFANSMNKRGHEVTILYASPTHDTPSFRINKDVKLVNLMKDECFPDSKKEFNKSIPIPQRLIRKILSKIKPSYAKEWNFFCMNRISSDSIRHSISRINPDVIVTFNTFTNALVKKNIKGIPVIVMFHIMPDVEIENYASKYEREILSENAAIQVLLKHNVPYIKKISPDANVKVIPNAVTQTNAHIDYRKEKEIYHILEVARLHRLDKRQHILIEAFSKLAKSYPNWHLDFWGKEDSNGYYEELKALIKNKGLEDQVFLHGATNKINKIYLSSDIFCFPSLKEGFGMAMAEAMSFGLPVIAMKDCVATQEIFSGQECGILVDNNIDDIAFALRKMMDNPDLREKYGKTSSRMIKNYAPEIVWSKWESLLKDVIYNKE